MASIIEDYTSSKEIPFSHFTKASYSIRLFALGDEFDPTPINHASCNDRILGYAISISDFWVLHDSLKSQGIQPEIKVSSARAFKETIRKNETFFGPEDRYIQFVTFSENPHHHGESDAATLIVIPDELMCVLSKLPRKRYMERTEQVLPTSTQLNVRNAVPDYVVSAKDFENQISDIRDRVTKGYIVYKSDRRVVALPPNLAARLQAHVSGAEPIECDDVRAASYNVGTAKRHASIFDRGHFTRVLNDRMRAPGTVAPVSFVLAGSYWAEFLDIAADGYIKGIKQDNSIPLQLNVSARVRSDYKSMSDIRLLPHDHGNTDEHKINSLYIERALHLLRQTDQTISLLGKCFRVKQTAPGKVYIPTPSSLSYADTLTFCFNVGRIDDFDRVRVTSHRKPGTFLLGTHLPDEVRIQIGKRSGYKLVAV